MLDQQKIERINALAKKSRTEGLNEEEKAEQAALRAEYIRSWRQGLEQTLSNVRIIHEDGSEIPLKKKERPPEA
jgi:uncharacterized protein YnzC (UPF0291/DUF896 family)